jgi:hypothetical protein
MYGAKKSIPVNASIELIVTAYRQSGPRESAFGKSNTIACRVESVEWNTILSYCSGTLTVSPNPSGFLD